MEGLIDAYKPEYQVRNYYAPDILTWCRLFQLRNMSIKVSVVYECDTTPKKIDIDCAITAQSIISL